MKANQCMQARAAREARLVPSLSAANNNNERPLLSMRHFRITLKHVEQWAGSDQHMEMDAVHYPRAGIPMIRFDTSELRMGRLTETS